MTDLLQLQYPIGKFHRPTLPLDTATRAALIDDIARLPAELRAAAEGMTDAQLDTPYRPGGWTARQVLNHVPDSHMNGYTRMKLAVTEDRPTIKPYAEEKWAELPEARTGPVGLSLSLLDALHARWAAFLRGLSPSDFERPLVHPELGELTVDVTLAIYAWHGKHHTAHVKSIRGR